MESMNLGDEAGTVTEQSQELPAISGESTGPDVEKSRGRRRDGRFGRGNQAAIKHGLHARVLPPEVEALLDDVTAFRDESISDDGGPQGMSRRRRSLHDYRAVVHRNIQKLAVALERGGLFDDRGRLRVPWISKIESLMATARAIDGLLGTERNPRDVTPPTASKWLEARAREEGEPKNGHDD